MWHLCFGSLINIYTCRGKEMRRITEKCQAGVSVCLVNACCSFYQSVSVSEMFTLWAVCSCCFEIHVPEVTRGRTIAICVSEYFWHVFLSVKNLNVQPNKCVCIYLRILSICYFIKQHKIKILQERKQMK